MIDVVERLSRKYASGLDKNKAEFLTNDAITIQFDASPYEVIYKKVCKMIENKEITEINDDEDFLKRLVDDDKKW